MLSTVEGGIIFELSSVLNLWLSVQTVTAKTASRDLKGLCESGILAQIGTTGKGTYYILSSACPPKEDIKGTSVVTIGT